MGSRTVPLLAFLFLACASTPWKPVDPSSGAFDMKGFAFDLGGTEGWYVNSRSNADRVLLVKRNNPNDPFENYAIEAYASTAPVSGSDDEFLAAVKRGKAIHGDPRYRIKQEEFSMLRKPAGNCVLSHTVAEDAGQAPGFGLGVHRRPGAMIFEQSTLTCRQTSRPTRILDLSFSLRSYPGEGDPAFMEKSLKLFGSVVIE